MADQADDAAWFRYILNYSVIMRDCASQWTTYKTSLLSGTGPMVPPVNAPAPPPTPMPPGILTRFRETVRRVKASAAYTEATGEAIGILGPDQVDPDPATLAPTLSLRTSGGQVEVVWNKGMMEGVEIQVDRGSGSFAFLALDTRPNYIDTAPFPSPAATWKYRAIYCKDAQRLGQWSNVAEITVGG